MSTVIDVESWTPVTAYIPETLVDADGVAYTSWDLNDAGQFVATVLDSYTVGSAIAVRLSEATLSTAKNHKWQLVVTLFRAGSGTIATETITQQYQCGLVADLLTLRTITIATAGEVNGVAVAAGDFITVTLTRIAATSDDDPNPIQMYAQSYVQETTAGAGTGDCLGRVGEIIANVRDLFNDEGGGDIENDSTIIGWMNRCQAEMAKAHTWRKTAYLTLVSGQRQYDLLSSPDDFVGLFGVKWASTGRPLSNAPDRATWNAMTVPSRSGAQPFWYFLEGGSKLEVDPIPTSGVSSGLLLEYSYLPDDLGCDTGYTPVLAEAYDIAYVHYCLSEGFKRDRQAPGAAEKAQTYRELYERTLQDILGSAHGATSWGTCSGRLGTIIMRARAMLNQAGVTTLSLSDYDLTQFCNEAQEDLAREGYWKERLQRFSGIATQAVYDLTTIEPSGYTLDKVLNVAWLMSDGYYYPLKALDSYADYEILLYEGDSGTDEYPTHYYIDNNDLIVWPTPTTTSASGLQLRYTYLPATLDCTSGRVTPATPPAHDQLYQAAILYKAFERASDQPMAETRARYWEKKYEKARRQLHGQNTQRQLRVRPGR